MTDTRAQLVNFLNAFKADPFSTGADKVERLLEILAMQAAAPTPNGEGVIDLIVFLDGRGPLEGVWFGEIPPGHRGQFWWRKYLPKLAATPINSEGLDSDERIARLQRQLLAGIGTIEGTNFIRVEIDDLRAALEAVRAGDGR